MAVKAAVKYSNIQDFKLFNESESRNRRLSRNFSQLHNYLRLHCNPIALTKEFLDNSSTGRARRDFPIMAIVPIRPYSRNFHNALELSITEVTRSITRPAVLDV